VREGRGEEGWIGGAGARVGRGRHPAAVELRHLRHGRHPTLVAAGLHPMDDENRGMDGRLR
jgi:hypothetical protein